MFPTTCGTTASLSEPTTVGDRHTMTARSPSVGISLKAIGLQGMFATLGVSPAGCLGLSEVAQSCLTLCDPMDCSQPGSFVQGIFQAKVLEWIAISFSRGSSQPRDRTRVSALQAEALPSEPPCLNPSPKVTNIPQDQISTPLLWNIWSVASFQFVLKPMTNSYNQDPAPL